jgi:uncharacterized repeat protein (TIGR03803 family)
LKTIVPLGSKVFLTIARPYVKPKAFVMNLNLYPSILFYCVFCLIISFSTTANGWADEQTSSTSFISKPVNNEVNVSAPVLKITANVVSGATRYTISLSSTPDFSADVLTKTSEVDNQRTIIFTGLKYAMVYYVRAMTNNSPYGKISKFTTKAEVFPTVAEPAGGKNNVNPVVFKVTLSPIPGASQYTVEVNSKSDFTGTSRTLASSVKDQTSFLFKDLKYGAAYFVRVKSDISTKFGPASKFTTRKQIPQRRLWGITTAGGTNDAGTVFSFSVDSSTFTKHHDYIESGDYPNAYLDGSLTHAPDGGFYGNSECERNGTCGNGEIFYVSPLGEFSYVSKPWIHDGSVMLASNNQFYVVDDWINYFQGGIIRMPAEPTEFELSQVLFRIKSKSQGQNPNAELIELNDGFLYGVAPFGGATNHGVIYKIKLDGTGFQVILDFNQPVTGAYPQSHLFAGSDGYLYGTANAGGQFNQGTVFKILPDGSGFKKLLDFSGTNGSQPHGSLVEKNKKLFGTTSAGGSHNHGVVFSINTDGSGYKTLFSFNGINGDTPFTTPTIVDNFLFGMTTLGGMNDKGVIFKMNLDGTSYAKLYDFTDEMGANPTGSLLLAEDFFPAKLVAASESEARIVAKNSYTVGVFPNPFINNFTAEVSSDDQGPVKLMLTDLHGQIISEMMSNSNTSITLGEQLNKGIYILKIVKGKEVTSHRVVKK